jgi:hypothetical protein
MVYSLIFFALILLEAISIVGILYPFWPFRRRSRAALSLFVSIVAMGMFVVMIDTNKKDVELEKIEAKNEQAVIKDEASPFRSGAPRC